MFHMQSANIDIIETAVKEAAAEGADMIALPECWNGPYSVRFAIGIKIGCSEALLGYYWILCVGCESIILYHFGSRETTSFERGHSDEGFGLVSCVIRIEVELQSAVSWPNQT